MYVVACIPLFGNSVIGNSSYVYGRAAFESGIYTTEFACNCICMFANDINTETS